jgi:6-phosphogluconolactonase (cycloisomerase 2 family)
VGTNSYGQIDVYEINSESGVMRPIPSSPFPSGGRDPVAEATSTDGGSLFVVNQDDNTIVQFVIGSDGKLYPFNTVNTPGVYPLAVTTNKSNLFVVDTYQPLPTCSTAQPCSGSIAVYPLTAGGTASSDPCTASVCMNPPVVNPSVTGTYWPLTLSGPNSSDVILPTAINVVTIPGTNPVTYVYVSAYDSSATPSSVGYVFGFSVGSSGALTALSGSPFVAGIKPSAIAGTSSGSNLYVTDFASNDVLGYSISASNGNLTALTTGSGGTNKFLAGNQPSGIVVDPDTSYPYAYVANSLDSTVTAYSIANGTLTSIGTYATGTNPVAIGIDPSTNHFLFTANFLGSNISDFELSTTAGTLLEAQDEPYTSNNEPTAVAAVPHNGTGSGTTQ